MMGKIKAVRIDGGYGFLIPDAGGPDLFFHCSTLELLVFSDQLVGQRVEYSVTNKGRGPCASRVRPAPEAKPK